MLNPKISYLQPDQTCQCWTGHTRVPQNSQWHRSNKVLRTFLTDLAPYLLDDVTQRLQSFQACIPWCQSAAPPRRRRWSIRLWSIRLWIAKHSELTVKFKMPRLRRLQLCAVARSPAERSHQDTGTLWSAGFCGISTTLSFVLRGSECAGKISPALPVSVAVARQRGSVPS